MAISAIISDVSAQTQGPQKRMKGEVFCPRCGAFQGTQDGLRTNETAQECPDGCEPLGNQGKSMLSYGGGTEFPIRYSTLHMYQKTQNIVDRLKRMGYSEISSGEVPGIDEVPGVEELPGAKGQKLVPKNLHRRDSRDTIISSEREFEDFIGESHPTYLEIEHRVNGKPVRTYLKYSELPLLPRIKGQIENLLRW